MAHSKLTKDQKRKKKLAERKKKDMQKLQHPHLWALHSCYVSVRDNDEDNVDYIHILLTKYHGNNYLTAFYLLDLSCFGVADAFISPVQSAYDAEAHIEDILGSLERDEIKFVKEKPDFVYALIQAGIGYAKQWGFTPHADFVKAQRLLPPDLLTRETSYTIECGNEDGLPLAVMTPQRPPLTDKQEQLIRDAGGEIVYEDYLSEAFEWGAEIEELRFSDKKYGDLENGGSQKYTDELVEKFRNSETYQKITKEKKWQRQLSDTFCELYLVDLVVERALREQGLTLGMTSIDFDDVFDSIITGCVTSSTPEDIIVNLGELLIFSLWMLEQYPDINPLNFIALEVMLSDQDFMASFVDNLFTADVGGFGKRIIMAAADAGVELGNEEQLAAFMETINQSGGVDFLDLAVESYQNK